MPNDDPYYLSEPKIREAIQTMGFQFRVLFVEAIRDLEALGADSNERVSALAHCAAQGVDVALEQLGQRIMVRFEDEGLKLAEDPGLQAAHMFMVDVLQRALAMAEVRRGAAAAQ
jgi:hypothetical protein